MTPSLSRARPASKTAAAPGAPLRTGSLRTRTVVAVTALLAVLLLALALTVQALVGDRLRAQVVERLGDRAAAAAALVGTVDDDDLADRLSAQGVSVVVTSPDGGAVTAGPSPDDLRAGPGADPLGELPGPAGGPRDSGSSTGGTTGSGGTTPPDPTSTEPTSGDATVSVTSSSVVDDGDLIRYEAVLSDGTELALTAGTSSIDDTLATLRGVLLGASAAFLLLAAGALVLVVRRTLRPLERMTAVARSISGGDRGRRLRPTRPTTELGRTAAAFDEMLDDLERAEGAALAAEARLRSFVSDAAHELRTPVAGIQAAADTLVRAQLDDDERERLTVHVVRESLRAGRLIGDMLLMARLDEGLALNPRPLDVAEVARGAAERQRVRGGDVAVEVVTDGPVPPVSGDLDRLGQVVGNLLDNAVRHARSSVRVSVASRGVDDDGRGVDDADRERVFDRLVRLDEARARGDGGSGLGLPIARAIARAHGGDVVCLPRAAGGGADPGLGGARFELRLPAAARSATQSAAAVAQRTSAQTETPLHAHPTWHGGAERNRPE
ncbi:HAMP domain-containing histidine kinase [Frigoribacterium sp. NBH87]|uniref:HAMP domain-containing sensor histidine kinase n=1 Tax=Frigoribacterium sp. NBH87 TaxID=2596916 RepID=UPI0016231F6B|nr:HAMP domain-containing sensor histidine kinase [Frigoribacterium sp. NBH87]QNE44410.1 HAMP domain-containing histidine kinase [Frigoribacterium sp. NBH87]